jgi:hypothetical protein
VTSFRLRTHLIAYCTAITLLLTTALIFLYSDIFKGHAIDNLSAYGMAVTRSTSFAVIDDLITEDYAPLQEYVRDTSSLPTIDSIQIANNQGNILAASEVRLLGTVMEDDFVVKDNDLKVKIDSAHEQLVVTAPISVGGMVFGVTGFPVHVDFCATA